MHRSIIFALTALILQVQTQAVIRYMPFGDSITDYGCWRAWLWEKFKQDGHNVEFVGTRKAEATCNNLNYDRDHEGHPGYQGFNIANQNQLVDWLRENPTDIITMHLGTNDIFLGNRRTPDILAAYTKLVDQMRASNAKMRIIVRQKA
jgi:lysophospholipase L1-like esterase